MYFDNKRFNEWEEKSHIPSEIIGMVNWIAEKIGYPVEEETICIRNRFNEPIGFCKGFIVSHCTSSYADGPGTDYAPTFIKWLCGLGFELGDSYGDNGMDSATNWHDTYWHKEIIYKPSVIYDNFRVYEDDDEEENDWYDNDY